MTRDCVVSRIKKASAWDVVSSLVYITHHDDPVFIMAAAESFGLQFASLHVIRACGDLCVAMRDPTGHLRCLGSGGL